jgi:predicted ATPase/DNA-binding CsgD family transcriptional regulator
MTLVQAKRRRGQLPAEVTGFVGREGELVQLAELLHGVSHPATGRDRAGHDRPRLITVTGVGGVGKTRLALRAAARAGRWYPDGTYFADLGTVTAAESLPAAVLAGLSLGEGDRGEDGPGEGCLGDGGFNDTNDGGDLSAVLARLRERRALLVLDTCEHLIDACARLTATLLRNTASVTVLATSRQPLDVPGEHILPLRPLPVPDHDARETAGSAVELLSQRAASVVAGFTVTDELLPDVTAVCQRLDGIPLAIELAALRLRALPLAEMGRLARADDGHSRVLTGARRTVVARHRSLPRSIEWSLGLCSQAERTAWARLSVFAGGFDLAAAEAVCADEGLPSDQVTQAVIGLIDKSVLLREPPLEPSPLPGLAGPPSLAGTAPGPGGELPSRYRLPCALREAGAELLAGTADGGAAVRARYLGHWTRAAERFASHLLDDQLRQYRAMGREHANLHAALEYALTLPDADQSAARLGYALYMYWVIRGELREGRAWLDKIVDRYPAPAPERARALAARAFLTAMAGDLPAAQADAEASIALATEAGDLAACARGYVALHRVKSWTGDLTASTATASLAIPVLEQAGDMLGLAQVDIHSSLAHLATDPQACVDICTRALRRLPAGELWATGYLLGQVVMARFRMGDHAAAAASAGNALVMKLQLGDAVGIAHGLRVLGFLAGVQGRYERAAVLLGAAPPLWEHAGYHYTGVPFLEEVQRGTVQAAIDSLGDVRYAQLREAGAGQPLDEILALALGSAGQAGPEPAPGPTAVTPAAPSSAASAAPPPAALPPAPPGAVRKSGPGAPSTVTPATGPLTGREVEIAQLVANGLSNKEIARRMAISKRTVDAHVDHIFAKLGISSRVQLTLWLRDRVPRGRPGHQRGHRIT